MVPLHMSNQDICVEIKLVFADNLEPLEFINASDVPLTFLRFMLY